MHTGFNLAEDIEDRIARTASTVEGFDAEFAPDVRPADPKFGDFQANGVLAFAKRNRKNPRQLAENLAQALREKELDPSFFDVSIAGPGFINVTVHPTLLLIWLKQYQSEQDLRSGASDFYSGKRMVIDYGSPNTAKQMHVGHLRSLVIGEAISRLLEFCGARLTRDNHIGDWGTQFGKILYAYKNLLDTEALERDPLEELERLYKAGDALCKTDPKVLEEARRELVKLQKGDPGNVALWQKITAISNEAFQEIYKKLDIRFDLQLGESFYQNKVNEVYEELTKHGIAEESQGAIVVFHPEHPRFAKQPFIVRKSDGASNYATTDLATALYRTRELKADTIVYVTDGRQQDHFQQLFLTVKKWFLAAGIPVPELDHVWFGTILGENGKAIKTRAGDPIKLKDLLQEAEDRALAIVREKNASLSPDEQIDIAEAVGIGSVRYADLSQNRTSDYVFSWNKLLSFDGNTAPYLLYAVARIHSIFARLGPGAEAPEEEASGLETPQEQALARKLVGFAPVLQQTITDLRPHFLCTYLYELTGEFSSFYNANKVITDEPDVRARRLLLCRRTLLILETSLNLLGIRTLKRM
ncbi:MAG: arginine--tRNA ligase [Opitutales bacterium]